MIILRIYIFISFASLVTKGYALTDADERADVFAYKGQLRRKHRLLQAPCTGPSLAAQDAQFKEVFDGKWQDLNLKVDKF